MKRSASVSSKANRRPWQNWLDDALLNKNKAEKCLTESVRFLMLDKGFSPKEVELFNAAFTSGDETVITFNEEGEMADLDIRVAASVSKDYIISRLSNHISKESVELLTK